MVYAARRAVGGKAFKKGSTTEITVPGIQYPKGYGARVSGARVTSAADASTLRLALCPGAKKVSLTVKPGRTPAAARTC